MFERIIFKEVFFAILIRQSYKSNGIHFFTQDTDYLQLGYMNRPAGYEILPHRHNEVKREVLLTEEVLFIKSGRVRIDFYTDAEEYVLSAIVAAGDVVLLSKGGHGFKMLEPSEIIEVKQGPYAGEIDKVRFNAIEDGLVKYK